MKTRLTELLGIKYPIILSGMTLVSDARLTAAVSNAGGLGIMAAGGLSPRELREGIRLVRSLTDKPFAVNILEGWPGAEELAEVVIKERVPIIAHGRGNPDWLIRATREYGAINIPTVGALKHAIRAERDGAEALIVQGLEGGGHTGYVASMVLLPLVTSQVKIPVAAAGGFCDGRGLAAALALGADGIAMGTRFALTQESPLPDNVKRRYLGFSEEQTVVTPRVTGVRCRAMRNEFLELVESGGWRSSLWHRLTSLRHMSRTYRVPVWRLLLGAVKTKREREVSLTQLGNLPAAIMRLYRGVIEGDDAMGFLPGGQVVGRVTDVPTCEELVQRIVIEAEAALAEAQHKFACPRVQST
ncbi:MAG TPA: nitronate monooxygenase [Dehalococcoidia bacterium]|nr:nitronate monooxygenase [Dehalococcoidia bacterium]